MIGSRLSGACNLRVPGMIEHYQKRIEASRYSVETLSMGLVVRSCRHDLLLSKSDTRAKLFK
jgi:hypothetical protein